MRALWSCTLTASLALALVPATAEGRPCRLGSRARPCAAADLPPPQYPPPRGLPALIVGTSLFAFAIPPLFFGTTMVVHHDRRPSDWPYAASPDSGYHMLVTGVVMAAVAVPLMAVGAVRYERYRRWRDQWAGRIAPLAGRTAGGGGYVGLSMRF